MVTSVALHPAVWMDGIAVNANDLRLQTVAGLLTGAAPSGSTGIAARPGVRYSVGTPLAVAASSGMNISVSAGVAFVQGSTSATAGMYTGCLDTTSTLTVTTSDPTNPRIDNVIMRFVDNGNNTSTGTVELQAGTPAASPVAPTIPANSLLLAQITVGASVSSITSGNIADKRVYTAAMNGVVPLKDVIGGFAGPVGMYGHDLSTGRLKTTDGSGNARQPKVGAFGAVYTSFNGNVATNTSSYSTIVQVSVTCDGATEIEITAEWTGLICPGGVAAGDQCEFGIVLDGFINGMIFCNGAPSIVRVDSGSTNVASGGCIRNWITPSSGTHTVGLIAMSVGHAFSIANPFIRVAPSLQQ